MSNSEYPIDKEVYRAGNQLLSLRDLLRSFLDAEYQLNGMSRISDIHFKLGETLRYRFDGDLEPIPEGTVLDEDAFRYLIYPMLSEFQIAKYERKPYQDVDAGYLWQEEMVNFRLNVFRDRDGPAATLRMLPRQPPPVASLGFHREETWQDICQLKQGLVIVTGVTGSGKTTTVASLLQYINEKRKARIITLEDPVEYHLKSAFSLISQREIGEHVGSFGEGLRSALREAPDVIFVGEIRDRESATLALTAAETGHLVLTTLHTRDATGAITRLVDLFPATRTREVQTQLSFVLSYVLAQKLVMRADRRGRVLAIEVMKNTGSIANNIRLGKLHQLYAIMETQSRNGMMTLEQHLSELVGSQIITRAAALQHANDPSSLEEQARD